jgi:hypothetical protein
MATRKFTAHELRVAIELEARQLSRTVSVVSAIALSAEGYTIGEDARGDLIDAKDLFDTIGAQILAVRDRLFDLSEEERQPPAAPRKRKPAPLALVRTEAPA